MKIFKFIILILSVLNLGSLSFGATIRVLTSAEVSSSHFTLGDIAIISAASPKEEAILGSISLGVIPADESVLILTASQISEKLRGHLADLKNQKKRPKYIG
jgi:hypothetical protein